jgi:hypothetical protein
MGLKLLVLAPLLTVNIAQATPVPKLGQGERWVVVASSKDLDIARGVADHYPDMPTRIIQSSNGWLAVALGPYKATTREALAQIVPGLSAVPVDTVFSVGKNYLDVVWTNDPAAAYARPLSDYAPGKPATVSSGTLTVTVEMGGTQDAPGATIVTGRDGANQIFRFEVSGEHAAYGAAAGVLQLDPDSPEPEIVFTRFSGGAHCCTETWFVTKPKGSAGWSLIEGGMLDGEGYFYEDRDGDGTTEIIARDNNFLYAFASYAGSFAPLRVNQLRGTSLNDVTFFPAWRAHLKRELGFLEHFDRIPPQMPKSNAYLAEWVALKSALGEGDEAWAQAMQQQEAKPEFGPMDCTTGKPISECAGEDMVFIPFDRALAEFLKNTGYPVPTVAQGLLK